MLDALLKSSNFKLSLTGSSSYLWGSGIGCYVERGVFVLFSEMLVLLLIVRQFARATKKETKIRLRIYDKY